MMDIPQEISRVTRTRAQAQASYDRISRWYDLLAEGSEGKFRDLGLHKLAVQPGERALEIGFGTGHGLVALARAVGPLGQAHGIDLSSGMCGVAQARLVEAGASERVALACGNALALPYPASAFDAAYLSFTLELFDTPEMPRVLRECRRVLRGGGRLCVVSLSKRGGGWVVALYERLHEIFPAAIDCRPIYVQEALAEAGFEVLEVEERSMWGLPVEIVLARIG
jgi:ubiquinone/menaquinone biosynthesis C-methylase UbiE